ncbi:hypothetical protein [Methylorubrum extorquens]|uniref:PepSY domain-containing protein n=1 Tax=Methylorubrum extorquens (strain CM4 / NCIMB 13688) TaxID=440085 RepID=B7L2E4_METC4|nr:hypothetical protein [Methylorubrum extorquens]ACK83429.1 conserved hypothetical protein [Methylorubrum extorquens CM4]
MASGKRAAPALAALLVGMILATPARSALAPTWQRLREFQRVLEEAAKALEGRPIDAVERLDPARFRVRAGPCRLEVRIVHHPRQNPGPQLFEAIPGEPDCS